LAQVLNGLSAEISSSGILLKDFQNNEDVIAERIKQKAIEVAI
jgi:hypothetical protein